MTPYRVRRTSKVKASKTLPVPSHMYLHCRVSMVGPKRSAYLALVAELIPSLATTRSWVPLSSSGSGASARNRSRTPSSRQRACRMPSRLRRLIAAKP